MALGVGNGKWEMNTLDWCRRCEWDLVVGGMQKKMLTKVGAYLITGTTEP